MSNLSLDNIITNDMNFKHLETTKDITISIKNESGYTQYPDATHTWTAKVSDGTNYVGDYAVKINQTSLIVDSENFTKLPIGSYQLEVWEEWIDPDGTKQRSIYPSPSQTIPFTIYANLTDQAEKEIKSIGFQDVVDQAVMNVGMNYVFKVNMIEPDQTATVVQAAADGKNYVTFNIPRGAKGDQGNVGPAPTLKIGTVTKLNSDQTPTANVSGDNGAYTLDLGIPQGSKGDTGTVDNTGLISAPAFKSLQAQVNNSAVGTNLLMGTRDWQGEWNNRSVWAVDEEKYNGLTVLKRSTAWSGVWKPYDVNPNTTYTFSFNAKASEASNNMFIFILNSDDWSSPVVSVPDYRQAVTTDWQRYSVTFTTKSGGTIMPNVCPYIDGITIYTAGYKLEKGSVATDWSLNPSEVLTQSDYAKIKAAIVALGGSLS